MKKLTQKQKGYIAKALMIVLVLFATAGISFLILSLFDIVSFQGGLQFNADLFVRFRDAWYGWLIMIVMQVVLTILLCVLPGVSMAFIVLCTTLYPNPWESFWICFISVMIASFVMYALGTSTTSN